MTEQTQAAAVEYNPFDPSQHATGGGLWDGRTVTVTRVRAQTEPMKKGDGSAVLDEKTKQPVIQTALVVWGIAEGSDDKERYETYGAGEKLVATPDGEGFVSKDGGPAKFHANSGIGKFSAALKGAGFDLGTLIERGADGAVRQRLSRLTGARLIFKGEPKMGKDGKPVKDKNGYTKSSFLPVRFVGYAAQSGTVAQPSAAGNGAAAATGVIPGRDALLGKAAGAVLTALATGPLTRAQLITKLAESLKGDTDANAVIGLVVRDDFHKGQPWKYDGTQASL